MSGALAWPPASATGVGSLPGEDLRAALRQVLDTVPDLPFLPELPARGPGAGLPGRTAALLVELPVDLQPSGWRLVPRAGMDLRRAQELWRRDLDDAAEELDGYTGPLKVAVAGPWTLAATVELPRGDKALRDPGAVRDLAASLAAGVTALRAELVEAVPGARVLVQLDEPSLPSVLAGRVPTASGFDVLPAPDGELVVDRLAGVLAAGGDGAGVHCCAAPVPWELLGRAGAGWVGVDLALLGRRDDDEIGQAFEDGLGLVAGIVATTGPRLPTPARSLQPLRELLSRLGADVESFLPRLALAPACGLAGASPDYAAACLAHLAEAARVLRETF